MSTELVSIQDLHLVKQALLVESMIKPVKSKNSPKSFIYMTFGKAKAGMVNRLSGELNLSFTLKL